MKIFHCSFPLKLPTDENGCILSLHIVSQEYKKAEDPLRGPIDSAEYSSDFVFIHQFESPVVREEREIWAYSTIAFIADLGERYIQRSHWSVFNRNFPCMEANYPHAIKHQRGAD